MHECGVAGAKIDFFERNDQIAMRSGARICRTVGAVPDGGHLPRLSRTGGLEPYLPQRDEL